jgi:hypothetical protein
MNGWMDEWVGGWMDDGILVRLSSDVFWLHFASQRFILSLDL